MNKTKLIEEMNKVIERNNRLFTKCRELEAKLEEDMAEIERLTLENAALKAENELLNMAKELERYSAEPVADVEARPSAQPDDAFSEPTVEESADNVATETAESSEPMVKHTLPTVDNDSITTTVLPEFGLKAASAAIGRVVLKSAEVCNTFAAASDHNSKDLINLALGRTEVFKSELLELISSGSMSDERLDAEIKVRETDVIEYFDLLLKQLQ